ncbi:fluoride efflux transporter FluC [Pelagibacterium montanilacus]|uniref:fluoride efflux transporter FluC n=1 Tax=Pelagibacterium montanilacus TaxID=2185280 RepID=UPI001FEC8CCE|nr:CrcB family protein [Pelagibacterium montanilacus]
MGSIVRTLDFLLLSAFMGVALGGMAGGAARHLVSGAVGKRTAHPALGTFAVNITGALAIGVLAGYVLAAGHAELAAHPFWPLLATGFLGGYTTVSSFSLQTFEMMRAGRIGAALINITGSLVLCIGAAALGITLAGGSAP